MSSITPGPWKFKYHMNIDGVGIMEAEFDVTVKDLNIIAAAPEMYELLLAVAANPTTNYSSKIADLLWRIKGDEDEEEDEE